MSMYKKWMQCCQRSMRRKNMQTIFYMILVALSAAIAVFIGSFAIGIYQKDINAAMKRDNQKLSSQRNNAMTQYIHRMIQFSDTLCYNVIKNNADYMPQMFQTVYDAYKDSIESIALFNGEGELLYVTPAQTLESGTDVTAKKWFVEALQGTENIHFFGPQVYDDFEQEKEFFWVLPMSRCVQINEGSRVTEGVLLISMKYSAFTEIFGNQMPEEKNYSFLMDSEGKLIYHPKHAQINAGFREYPPASLGSAADGFCELTLDGESVMCFVETVGYTGWKMVSVSGKEEINMAGRRYRLVIVCIILVVLLCAMLLGSYLSRVLTEPIHHLEEDVKRISEGDLNVKVHSSGSCEVYHLGKSIQKMTEKIRGLMRDIVREQEEKRKSELNSLQAQITPHFLYNTLDNIVWMIEDDKKEEACLSLTSLARLLRISLSKGKNVITLEDELEHVRNYLMLQSMRFADRFTYEIQMQPGIQHLEVLKLIVQPIVENAVYHGMERMYGDGEILIRAYTSQKELYISIRDNGRGMSREQLETLLDVTQEVPTKKGNGLGVRNVHERIQLYFGKQYGLTIESAIDAGTEVLLHLPAVMYTGREL